MKNTLFIYYFITILFMLVLSSDINPDTVLIKHQNYTTIYSLSKHYPLYVEWWETISRDGCEIPLVRKDKFGPDPLLKEETNLQSDYDMANKDHKKRGLKGFDRGHMCPAASNECQTQDIEDECFYFSNMSPQFHGLNAGIWKTLETATRDSALKYDSVHVWAGNIGESERYGKLSIPIQCWKVIHILKNNKYYFYIFNNVSNQPSNPLNTYQLNEDEMEKITGVKFN